MRDPSPTPTPAAIRAEIRPGVWLDARRAVWFADTRRLAIADLHWGYAAAHQARGLLLPRWGDAQIEAVLRALVADYAPAEMIWLGDVVHAAEGAGAAERYLHAAEIPVIVLAGNHDRRWRGAAQRSLAADGFFFHHGDTTPEIPAGLTEICGHHHPAAVLEDGAGGRVKVPALVASPRRLILPAFSPWAGGAVWKPSEDPAETLWAVAPTRIFVLPRRATAARLAAR